MQERSASPEEAMKSLKKAELERGLVLLCQ
jgi:hypothetical protein